MIALRSVSSGAPQLGVSNGTNQGTLIAGFVVFNDHRHQVVTGDYSSPPLALAGSVHDDSDSPIDLTCVLAARIVPRSRMVRRIGAASRRGRAAMRARRK